MSLTLAIFLATYLAMALGRLPGFRVDRTGAALLGGIAMLVFEKIGSQAAWASIDFPTISLLFGLASSTLLTVLVIPALYVWLRDDRPATAR